MSSRRTVGRSAGRRDGSHSLALPLSFSHGSWGHPSNFFFIPPRFLILQSPRVSGGEAQSKHTEGFDALCASRLFGKAVRYGAGPLTRMRFATHVIRQELTN